MTKTRVGRSALVVAMAVALVNCTSGPSEQELAAERQASKAAEKAEQMKVKRERHVAAEMVMPLMATGSHMAPMPAPAQPQYQDGFEQFDTNPVKRVTDEPVSTFSADVDTTSYSFVRKQLNRGYLPEKSAVRLEEIVNYFDYNYPLPTSANRPFFAHHSST